MPVRLKRVYEGRSVGDGHRLLVMRFWPRGVRSAHVDEWERGLAPSGPLLADLNGGAIGWAEYEPRFRREMAEREDSRAALRGLVRRAQRETVTLLCRCPDEARCHRSLLRDLALGAGGAVSAERRGRRSLPGLPECPPS